MLLTSDMYELLVILDRAKLETRQGDGWVAGSALRHIPRTTRNQAQTKGWMIGQGATALRKYKITPAGRTALANNAGANLAIMPALENGFVPTGDDEPEDNTGIINSLVKSQAQPVLAALEIVEAAKQKNIRAAVPTSLAPYPQACVQAVAILEESFPEVTDLVDALVKINQRKARDHE